MSNIKAPDEVCGLCERGVARLVYLPQALRVGTAMMTIENVPMRECAVCGQRYFSRDVATTLEQIRLKLATSHKPVAQLKFEFIDRELAA
jgi:YgiT-type zinc finger domain-containing protein